jgi:hypothetical protein
MTISRPYNLFKESFRAKMFALFALLILIISVAFIALYVQHESTTRKLRLVTEGELLARLLAYNSRLAVFSGQESVLNQAADAILQYHDAIISASVYERSCRHG